MKSQNGYPVIETNRTTGALPRLRKWQIPGTNRYVYVRDGAVGLVLLHLALWFHEAIERLDVGIWDDWGWAVRPVRGQVNGYSNHAAGCAVDLNATLHPRGVGLQTFKIIGQVARIRARLAFYRGCVRWGGDYVHSPKDGMHFEIVKAMPAVQALALVLAKTPRGKRVLAANPGAWEVVSSGTKMQGKPRTGTKTPPPKKPTPPAPKPTTTGAEILSAGLVETPSDHRTLRARMRAGRAVFVAATANIRATPPMRAVNVQRCVDLALGHDVTVAAFNEMGGRDLVALLANHPGWAAVQGPKGDRRRAPIAYDTRVWDFVDSEVVQFSTAAVKTKLGTIHVPSGNRWATVVRLRHKVTGEVVAFISYHAIAHWNVGAHFGWTGKGPKILLKLRAKIANPAIQVAKQGMAALEAKIRELRDAGCYVVPLGDWNADAFADLAALAKGKAEPLMPAATMRRAGVATVYSTKKLERGTAGRRGIDYAGIAAPTKGPTS